MRGRAPDHYSRGSGGVTEGGERGSDRRRCDRRSPRAPVLPEGATVAVIVGAGAGVIADHHDHDRRSQLLHMGGRKWVSGGVCGNGFYLLANRASRSKEGKKELSKFGSSPERLNLFRLNCFRYGKEKGNNPVPAYIPRF